MRFPWTSREFRWLNKQGVASSNGFILQSVERYFYNYIEGDHVMKVDVEPLGDMVKNYSERIVSRSLARWQPPYDTEELTLERIAEIRKNISAALEFMKINHKFC